MLKKLIDQVKDTLAESAEVEEGTHYNEKFGRGVPLPKHLHAKSADAIRRFEEAQKHLLLGRRSAGAAFHAASAAHFDASHALKESGFSKLAKYHGHMSHIARRFAVSK